MDRIWELFSAAHLMLVRQDQIQDFVADFGLEVMESEMTWDEASQIDSDAEMEYLGTAAYKAGEVIITSEVNGRVLVDARSVNWIDRRYGEYFSLDSGMYLFNANIWDECMLFEYHRDAELVRRVEYLLQGDQNVDIEVGLKLEIESDADSRGLPEPPCGYDPFFYPMVLLECLGIGTNELGVMLDAPAMLYRLPEEEVVKIRSVVNDGIEKARLGQSAAVLNKSYITRRVMSAMDKISRDGSIVISEATNSENVPCMQARPDRGSAEDGWIVEYQDCLASHRWQTRLPLAQAREVIAGYLSDQSWRESADWARTDL